MTSLLSVVIVLPPKPEGVSNGEYLVNTLIGIPIAFAIVFGMVMLWAYSADKINAMLADEAEKARVKKARENKRNADRNILPLPKSKE